MSIAANAVSPLATGSLDAVAARLVKTRRYAVAAIVAWFVLGVSSTWLPTPDSALYLMLGRSLAQGHGYALDGQPHAYVPPGYPLFLAALERAGLGSMFCLNLAMGVIGLLSVWMSYRARRRTGFTTRGVRRRGSVGLEFAPARDEQPATQRYAVHAVGADRAVRFRPRASR